MAADVCRALEIRNTTDALGKLDGDEKMTLDSTEGHSGQRGGAQSFNIVNEPGLYSLVLGSRKAKQNLGPCRRVLLLHPAVLSFEYRPRGSGGGSRQKCRKVLSGFGMRFPNLRSKFYSKMSRSPFSGCNRRKNERVRRRSKMSAVL